MPASSKNAAQTSRINIAAQSAPRRLWLCCWLLVLLLTSGCERRQHLVQQHLLEFGTIIDITLVTDDLPRAQQLLSEIERQLEVYRLQWHAWQDSDLTRFNAALAQGATTEMPVSLQELIQLSNNYYRLSDGLFNPALGKLIAAHGFHHGTLDAAMIAAIKRDIPNMQDLVIDGSRARSSNPHLQLDFGGIAKGYAIGLIGNFLDRQNIKNYIVNAGGDLILAGNRFGRPWKIGIQNPFTPGVVASLQLDGRYSLFTSGSYRRKFWRGDQLSHHIIDPRSGESSRGVSSATVLATDPVRADVAATALMIDGQRCARCLANSLGIEDFIIIGDQRNILVSSTLESKLDIDSAWPISVITPTRVYTGDSDSILAE